MAIYSNYNKLGRIKLPSDVKPYALIDKDGRLIIASDFSDSSGVYHEGDHVIYKDNLYRFKTDHSAGQWNSAQVDQVTIDSEIKRLEGLITPYFSSTATYSIGDHVIYQGKLYRFKYPKTTAGAWDGTLVEEVSIDSEIQRLEEIIAGGIHYRGKTTTKLYDGADSSVKVYIINGGELDKQQGDMVIVDRALVAVEYAINTSYPVHEYIKHTVDNVTKYYIAHEAIVAQYNTSFEDIEDKLDEQKTDPEFLYDGSHWNILGPVADGLGDLAFKDTATGVIPVFESAYVEVLTYDVKTKNLVTTSVYTVSSTDAVVSKVIAKNNSTPLGNTNLKVGDAAITGQATLVKGLKDGSATTFNTDAVKNVYASGTTTFNTDAVKNVHASGTTTFNTEGYVAQVGSDTTGWEDCLIFATGATSSFSIESDPAETASFSIESEPASTGTFELATESYYTIATAAINIDITSATAASRLTDPATLATGSIQEGASGAAVVWALDEGVATSAVEGIEFGTTTVTVR